MSLFKKVFRKLKSADPFLRTVDALKKKRKRKRSVAFQERMKNNPFWNKINKFNISE